jgi:zeta-carotene desaturase
MTKSVGIIGGGLAGLSSAVFLKEKGFDVHLFEATPKLGGRTYSWFDKNLNTFIDNGQHILAGWCNNTFDYLDTIKTLDLLKIIKNLELNFFDTEKNHYSLKCPDVSAPLNIFWGLLKFKAFEFHDKLSILKLRKLKNEYSYFKNFNSAKEILEELKQTENVKKYFWNPLIYAVFNTSAENVAPEIFLNIIKKGFYNKEASSLLIPSGDLNKIFIKPAESYFEKNNILISKNTPIQNILLENDMIKCIKYGNDEEITFDYYISAVPFFSFNKLFAFDDFNKYFVDTGSLKASAIVSIHIFFENEVNEILDENGTSQMVGLVGTTVQWIFKKSNKHISLIISGADIPEINISRLENEKIFRICLDDLRKCIKGFDSLKIKDYKIIKEKRATFIPDKESSYYRIPNISKIKNLFIAGDWTDTGLPSTIESAISSARKSVNAIAKLSNENS